LYKTVLNLTVCWKIVTEKRLLVVVLLYRNLQASRATDSFLRSSLLFVLHFRFICVQDYNPFVINLPLIFGHLTFD